MCVCVCVVAELAKDEMRVWPALLPVRKRSSRTNEKRIAHIGREVVGCSKWAIVELSVRRKRSAIGVGYSRCLIRQKAGKLCQTP